MILQDEPFDLPEPNGSTCCGAATTCLVCRAKSRISDASMWAFSNQRRECCVSLGLKAQSDTAEGLKLTRQLLWNLPALDVWRLKTSKVVRKHGGFRGDAKADEWRDAAAVITDNGSALTFPPTRHDGRCDISNASKFLGALFSRTKENYANLLILISKLHSPSAGYMDYAHLEDQSGATWDLLRRNRKVEKKLYDFVIHLVEHVDARFKKKVPSFRTKPTMLQQFFLVRKLELVKLCWVFVLFFSPLKHQRWIQPSDSTGSRLRLDVQDIDWSPLLSSSRVVRCHFIGSKFDSLLMLMAYQSITFVPGSRVAEFGLSGSVFHNITSIFRIHRK